MRDIEALKRDAEFQARQEALAALKESNDRDWERSGNGNDRPGYRDALISALSAWARTVFDELAHNLTHEATDRKEYRRKLTDAKKRILAEIFPVRRARSSRPGKLVRPLHRKEIEMVGCCAPECELRSDDDGLVLTPDGAFEPSRLVRQWEEDIGLWEVYCKDPALVVGFKFDRLQKRPRGAPERPFDRAHRLISNALEGRILHWQTQFRDSPDAQSRAETDQKPACADLGRDRQAVRSLVDWRNQPERLTQEADSMELPTAEGAVPTPLLDWQQVGIRFVSDERLQITRNGKIECTLNYVEFGLEDRRTGLPNKAWEALRTLATNEGRVRSGTQGVDWRKMEKRIQEIRAALRKYSQIDEDPIPYVAGDGYVARFTIGLSRSFDA